jgi:hypothetical protein
MGIRLPDGTRSVQSPWVWRGFLFMSLIGLGLCLTFAVGHQTLYAVAWAIITLGWFAISMWLWRRHVVHDEADWQRRRAFGTYQTPLPAESRSRGGHVDKAGHVT